MPGRTLIFPPIPDPGMGTLEGPDAVAQGLLTLLLTEPGERVGRPRYGTGLRRYLFQNNSVALRTAMRQTIASAIREHAPAVRLVDVLIASAPDEPGLLEIDVRYATPGDLSPRSLVLPYTLNPKGP